MEQIALDLLRPREPGLDNFVPGANAAALAALRAARAGAGEAFIYLWGEPGSGRSHLLTALGARPGPVPAFAAGRSLYAVDDVDALDGAGQAALFALQNEVRQAGGACLVASGGAPPRELALREDVRTRLAWGLVFRLHRLTEDDQRAALLAYAAGRGSRVDADLVPTLLRRLPRDMRTLTAVLDALDAYALVRQRALTVPLLREWLAQQGAAAPWAGGPPAVD